MKVLLTLGAVIEMSSTNPPAIIITSTAVSN